LKSAGELRRRRARSHDQRRNSGQRRRDGVRQTEREEVGIRIASQRSKRQHDQARERMRGRRRLVGAGRNVTQLFGHRIRGLNAIFATLRQRASNNAIDGGDR